MECYPCRKSLPDDGDYVTCSACSGSLHYECAKLSTRTWKAMSATKKASWRCIECRDAGSQGKGNTPSLDPEDGQEGIIASLRTFIEGMFTKQENLINKRVNKMETIITDLEVNIKQYLESMNEVKEEIVSLKSEMSNLKNEIECEKQYARSRNILIVGIPEEKGENTEDKILKLFTAMGQDIRKQDFITHRLKKNRLNKSPILVQFNNKKIRDAMIRQARKLRPKLSIFNEPNQQEDGPIYFNDHLTPHFSSLLQEAKRYKVTKGYNFVWINGSRIFLRKDMNSKPIVIKNKDDLEKL